MGVILNYYFRLLLIFLFSFCLGLEVQAGDLKRPFGEPLPYEALENCYANRGIAYLEGQEAVEYLRFLQANCGVAPRGTGGACFIPFMRSTNGGIQIVNLPHPTFEGELVNCAILNFEGGEGPRMHETCHWLDWRRDPEAYARGCTLEHEEFVHKCLTENRNWRNGYLCEEFKANQEFYIEAVRCQADPDYLSKLQAELEALQNEVNCGLKTSNYNPPRPSDCSPGNCTTKPEFEVPVIGKGGKFTKCLSRGLACAGVAGEAYSCYQATCRGYNIIDKSLGNKYNGDPTIMHVMGAPCIAGGTLIAEGGISLCSIPFGWLWTDAEREEKMRKKAPNYINPWELYPFVKECYKNNVTTPKNQLRPGELPISGGTYVKNNKYCKFFRDPISGGIVESCK